MCTRILIVEDSPTEALRAKLILEQEGYEISLASEGSAGLVRAMEDQPDLIILDAILPQMSGYEVGGRLRIHPSTASIPVILLIPDNEAADMLQGPGLITNSVIPKPYEPALLLDTVSAVADTVDSTGNQEPVPQAERTLHVGSLVLSGGYIVSVDEEAEGLLGLEAIDLAGIEFAEYVREDRASFLDLLSRAENGHEGHGEFEIHLNGGEMTKWWQITTTPFSLDGEGATRLTCQDVTAWIGAEEEVRRYQEQAELATEEARAAREAKGTFLANMSHELRTPLHGILGMIDLVLDTDLMPEQRDNLDIALGSANALLALVNDIMEFSELGLGRLTLEEKAFDLEEAAREAMEIVAPFAQEKQLDLSYYVAPEVPTTLVGDPKRLRQVLSNLVSNGIKFTNQGGVDVEVSLESERDAEMELHFMIRDTGIGISEDKLALIFDAFEQADNSTTREYGGIGLQLDLARQLVALMGGHLWVESEVDQGSTFHFTVTLERADEDLLPAAEDDLTSVEDQAVELYILLAEDSPTNQLIAVANLKKAGHTVFVAENGLKAVQAFKAASGSLPVNVKCVFEGEEECGSPSLEPFIREHTDLLAADVAVISDTPILDEDTPSIVYALRGRAYVEVEVTGPDHDLHSGVYGGAVHNPVNALCAMIARLQGEQGHVAIPGFYDKVRELAPDERAELAEAPFDREAWLREAGVKTDWGEPEYTIVERTTARPTLDVNGIRGGYTLPGTKAVLPSKASAKISMRLVPDQEPAEIVRLICDYLMEIAPPAVDVEVRGLHAGEGATVRRDSPAMGAAFRAYAEVFGREPVFVRLGGSIPVVATFQEALGIETILMGFGLPDDRPHSPNEKFHLPNFHRGIETMIHFMEFLGGWSSQPTVGYKDTAGQAGRSSQTGKRK